MSLSFQLLALSVLLLCVNGAPTLERKSGGSVGCGIEHWFNGITQYSGLKSSGRDRSYSIHLPPDYDENNPYPVVLGFHGSSSIGLFFEVDTRLSESQYSANVGYPFSHILQIYIL